MFTGLIQDIGTIAAINKDGDWIVVIETQKLLLDKIQIGASIACSGICLTVTEIRSQSMLRGANNNGRDHFKVQISGETLSKTTALHWRPGAQINLETALRMGDELGGHLLSGHVDGLARVIDKKSDGDSIRFEFEAPEAHKKFIANKGSVAIDGVSLTVNGVNGSHFDVNIIPHTQQMTTLKALNVGDEVNFEVDMIARYVERMMKQD